MAHHIEKPADLSGENFYAIFAELSSEAAIKEVEPRVAERRANYHRVLGFEPGDEYILLTLLLNKAITPETMYSGNNPDEIEGLFFESEEAYLIDQLTDVDALLDEEDLMPHFGSYDFRSPARSA